jgi:hypothetical protein
MPDLLIASKRHDVIAGLLSDPRELSWPAVGLVSLQDAETGDVRTLDFNSRTSKVFQEDRNQMIRERDRILLQAGVDHMTLSTDGDYVRVLTGFFRHRVRRLGR